MEENQKKNKKTIVTIISVVVLVAIIGIVYVIKNRRSEVSIEDDNKNNLVLSSIDKSELNEDYYIKINDNFYTFPTENEVNIVGKESGSANFGSQVYIYDDNKIPVFNFNNNDVQMIYQGEELPTTTLYKMSEPIKTVGIILNKEKKVTELLSNIIPDDIIGYECEIIDNDSIVLEEGDIVVNKDIKEIKLAFSKGTYRKEITINQFILTGILTRAYTEKSNCFTEFELTNENYANVIAKEEKQLTDGYYCLKCTNSKTYYFKIEQGINNQIALLDEIEQIKIYQLENDIKWVTNQNEFYNKIFANTIIYKPTYSKYEKAIEGSSYIAIGDIIATNGSTTLSKDYYGAPSSISNSKLLDGQRYVQGTIMFRDKYAGREEYKIRYLMKVEDYKEYLNKLAKYYTENPSQNIDTTKAINTLDFSDFKGFVMTYSISQGKTIGDLTYRYGAKVVE